MRLPLRALESFAAAAKNETQETQPQHSTPGTAPHTQTQPASHPRPLRTTSRASARCAPPYPHARRLHPRPTVSVVVFRTAARASVCRAARHSPTCNHPNQPHARRRHTHSVCCRLQDGCSGFSLPRGPLFTTPHTSTLSALLDEVVIKASAKFKTGQLRLVALV